MEYNETRDRLTVFDEKTRKKSSCRYGGGMWCSNDEHAVAVTKEAHFFFNRMLVGFEDFFSWGKSRYEHKER